MNFLLSFRAQSAAAPEAQGIRMCMYQKFLGLGLGCILLSQTVMAYDKIPAS